MVDKKRNIARVIAYTMFLIWPIIMISGQIGTALLIQGTMSPSSASDVPWRNVAQGMMLFVVTPILVIALTFLYCFFDLIGIIFAVMSIFNRRDRSLIILVGLGLVALLPVASIILLLILLSLQSNGYIFAIAIAIPLYGFTLAAGLVSLVLTVWSLLAGRKRGKIQNIESVII